MDQYTIEKYRTKAIKYFNEGRYDKSLKYINRLLDVDYNVKDFWKQKGFCHRNLNDHPSSVDSFDKALRIDPYDSQCWLIKGDSLAWLGSFKAAIKCFNKTLEFNPLDIDALNSKGYSLSSIGKYKEAIQCFDEALDLDPTLEYIKENKKGAMNALENENINFNRNSTNEQNNHCSNCGFENVEGAQFCSGCGKILINKENVDIFIICSHCFNENPEESEFCVVCGESLKSNYSVKNDVLIDVNNDSEAKISSLPGIGTILAKKTIKIRELNGGFGSKKEFCTTLNLKPHKTKIIETMITCEPIKRNAKAYDTRTVDF